MRIIILFLFVLMSNVSGAEIYKDFTPNLTIAQIKKNYPNATFEVVKAAWVKDTQSFLKLKGTGISGMIFLAFSYSDEYWKYSKSDVEKKIADNPNLDNSELNKQIIYYQGMIDRPIEEKMTLDWVRWVPTEYIPIERLKGRYGEPDKCDYTADDYTPYCDWTSKGVMAKLTDDKKFVFAIEYNPTKDEILASWGIEPEKDVKKEEPKIISKDKKNKKKI